jgi:hypothetical protein
MSIKNSQEYISSSSESFKEINNFQIVTISTEIGRGHPSYLDSVINALFKKDENLKLYQTTVFKQRAGNSRSLWKVIHILYLLGSRSGPLIKLYNLFRDTAAQPSDKSLILNLLGRNLKKYMRDFKGICLVAHPLLARILDQTCSVWYVHGEIAAPLECALSKVKKIFVPLKETGDKLVRFGANPESIVVCGLMIEPSLVETAENAFNSRLERINSSTPLTVGFFTSGAYPSEHVRKILAGVKSVIDNGMKAVIFTGTSPQKFQWFKKRMEKLKKNIAIDDGESSGIEENWEIKLIHRKTRQAETEKTIELVPLLDLFVAPSHERTNWAVGLGLPMFVLFPLIGTFSPQNFEFAQRQGVCYPIDSMEKAQDLGQIITQLRENSKLTEMAKKGFSIHPINGSEIATSHILENLPN